MPVLTPQLVQGPILSPVPTPTEPPTHPRRPTLSIDEAFARSQSISSQLSMYSATAGGSVGSSDRPSVRKKRALAKL